MIKLPEPYRTAVRRIYSDARGCPLEHGGYYAISNAINGLILLDLSLNRHPILLARREFNILLRLRRRCQYLHRKDLQSTIDSP